VNHSGVPHEPPGIPVFRQGRMSRLPQQPTRWPPQSFVAPFSWLLTRDVEQGREKLNFSTWDEDGGEAVDAAGAVADRSMPPRRYVLVHPDANLSQAERQMLVDALEAMDRACGGGRSGPGGGG
jgi:Haem-binding domain